MKVGKRDNDFFIHSSSKNCFKNAKIMIQRFYSFAAIALAFTLLYSCGEQGLKSGDEVATVSIDSTKAALIGVSGRLFSIPSPIQTAILIKDANVPYSPNDLHDPTVLEQYSTNSAQAINLGIYGTNMAYASLYDDGQSALRYFKAVDKLSNTLGISGAIDAKLLQRLGANAGNADSLLFLSGEFYRAADSYLKENERFDIAAYVLLGGWVEATHLTALAAKEGTAASRTRLAEQKESIKTLIEVIESVSDPEFMAGEAHAALKNLKSIYDGINKRYTFINSETFPERKTTVVHSESIYELSDEQLTEIGEGIAKLRQLIIA